MADTKIPNDDDGCNTLRFYAGVVVMQKNASGALHQYIETWTGWATSKDACIGAWISRTAEKHPDCVMSFHGCYDVTDSIERPK